MQADIEHTENWTEVVINFDPKFVAKTRTAAQGPMDPVVIKSLSCDLGGSMPEDESLCVVRCLKRYLKFSKHFRHGRTRLFISLNPSFKKHIHMSTISNWVKKLILYVYQNSSSELRGLGNVKMHHVRSVATSWALLKNASLKSIISAGQWKSHTSFTRFYLRDLSYIKDDMHVLGPVNASFHTT